MTHLYLFNNTLSGPIPGELGNLSQLTTLWLRGNSLSGTIPSQLGNLSQLTWLVLSGNSLTGSIPAELGNLSQLTQLELEHNSLSGTIPSQLGNLSQLTHLRLQNNALTGSLPRSLMQLTNLQRLSFEGQALCAPDDDTFQAWLNSIQTVSGPTCSAITLSGNIANQAFVRGQAITPLVLPEATGGAPTITYSLTPALPAGLSFDATARTISGTPTVVTATTLYTYTATDANGASASLQFSIEVYSPIALPGNIANQSFARAQPITPLVLPEATGGAPPISYSLTPALLVGLSFNAATRTITGTPTRVSHALYTYKATDANGAVARQQFSIEVYSPVRAEHASLPESFTVRGNYPNPFRHSTRLVFDLPWPARVSVEMMDLMGRRVAATPVSELAAGWARSIELNTHSAASSGVYLYRVHVASPTGDAVHTGRLVRIR